MNSKPKLRRIKFRFSLRTLFVLMTLFACLAWGVFYPTNWIRERRAIMSSGKVWEYDMSRIAPDGPAPWLLRPFGEQGRTTLWIFDDGKYGAQEFAARVRSCFPEAVVEIHDVHVPDWAEKLIAAAPASDADKYPAARQEIFLRWVGDKFCVRYNNPPNGPDATELYVNEEQLAEEIAAVKTKENPLRVEVFRETLNQFANESAFSAKVDQLEAMLKSQGYQQVVFKLLERDGPIYRE